MAESEAVPFVRKFYVHTIPQGEGGEQGDPLMPLLSGPRSSERPTF